MNDFNPYARYTQQMILNGFGEEAQLKLKHARVFVAGAGGLGCAALQYLAAANLKLQGTTLPFRAIENSAVIKSTNVLHCNNVI